MKILYYCQHVLGLGHFFRSLEICRSLPEHPVVLVTGGDPVAAAIPPHVQLVHLDGLMMDARFSALRTPRDGLPLAQVQQRRQQALWQTVARHAPQLLLIELYPFGRKAFAHELDPVLEAVRCGRLPPCTVVCSLRDILVEKKDAPAHEARVVDRLNRFFDALLVHADPKWVRLEETFQRTADIGIDWMYTGFVTPKPAPGDRDRIRASLGLGPADALIVASAGSGAVGAPLLQAVAATAVELQDRSVFWQMFTGPYLDEAAFQNLLQRANRRLRVARFAADFLAYLAAADISISMGGYNTTMNILAARTPALIYPFQQNREQRLRAERLGRTGVIQILDESDLNPSRMTEWVLRLLDRPKPSAVDIDLDGAARTAAWIAQRFPSTGQPETTPWH